MGSEQIRRHHRSCWVLRFGRCAFLTCTHKTSCRELLSQALVPPRNGVSATCLGESAAGRLFQTPSLSSTSSRGKEERDTEKREGGRERRTRERDGQHKHKTHRRRRQSHEARLCLRRANHRSILRVGELHLDRPERRCFLGSCRRRYRSNGHSGCHGLSHLCVLRNKRVTTIRFRRQETPNKENIYQRVTFNRSARGRWMFGHQERCNLRRVGLAEHRGGSYLP